MFPLIGSGPSDFCLSLRRGYLGKSPKRYRLDSLKCCNPQQVEEIDHARWESLKPTMAPFSSARHVFH